MAMVPAALVAVLLLSTPVTVDRVAVRFYSPETGGADHPLFVLERRLAFEARLEAMGDGRTGYDDRDVASAMDRDIAEQILVGLAHKLIDESPADKRPDLRDLVKVEQDVAAGMVARFGGRPAVDAAAAGEQIDPSEVDTLLTRAGLAAWYIDRSITSLLHPDEEQLREVYRTGGHPYRGQPFETVRQQLEQWYVVERARAAENAYVQSARSHAHVVIVR
ncbi:MAG TPA: hypothetical protein VF765_07280 [Polyangiaceae bacterium]